MKDVLNLVRYLGVEMKVTVFFLFFSQLVYGSYDYYKINPDGTYVVGGCYDGYKINPDGSYVLGGMYDGYRINSDGTYVVGWNCSK